MNVFLKKNKTFKIEAIELAANFTSNRKQNYKDRCLTPHQINK